MFFVGNGPVPYISKPILVMMACSSDMKHFSVTVLVFPNNRYGEKIREELSNPFGLR